MSGYQQRSPLDPHHWVYTTGASAPSPSLEIDVADLAGQVTEETAHLA
ncbi:Hypothetical protein A7982_08024 [Minicystis rosea]|nr:Hypothetical protein A7982_08024 [Minicystis rosea]